MNKNWRPDGDDSWCNLIIDSDASDDDFSAAVDDDGDGDGDGDYAGIYFCLNDRGLPTGEAFIEMETPQVMFYLTWLWVNNIMDLLQFHPSIIKKLSTVWTLKPSDAVKYFWKMKGIEK